MKRELVIELYGDAGNNASIRMPGRASPAVAIQSDTFGSIIANLDVALQLLYKNDFSNAIDELEGTIESLRMIQEKLLQETSEP